MEDYKNLLVITGASNSGKTLLKKQLEQLIEETDYLKNIHIVPIHTTRPARMNEQYGKDYYFDTKEQYTEASDKLTHALYRSVNGEDWYYWTVESDLDANPEVLNILFVGMQELYGLDLRLRYSHDNLRRWYAYLNAPEVERLERAIKRSALEPEGIKEAIRRANYDMADYSPEMLQKVGIGEKDHIMSDTNAFLNLLIRIHTITKHIQFDYLMRGGIADE